MTFVGIFEIQIKGDPILSKGGLSPTLIMSPLFSSSLSLLLPVLPPLLLPPFFLSLFSFLHPLSFSLHPSPLPVLFLPLPLSPSGHISISIFFLFLILLLSHHFLPNCCNIAARVLHPSPQPVPNSTPLLSPLINHHHHNHRPKTILTFTPANHKNTTAIFQFHFAHFVPKSSSLIFSISLFLIHQTINPNLLCRESEISITNGHSKLNPATRPSQPRRHCRYCHPQLPLPPPCTISPATPRRRRSHLSRSSKLRHQSSDPTAICPVHAISATVAVVVAHCYKAQPDSFLTRRLLLTPSPSPRSA